MNLHYLNITITLQDLLDQKSVQKENKLYQFRTRLVLLLIRLWQTSNRHLSSVKFPWSYSLTITCCTSLAVGNITRHWQKMFMNVQNYGNKNLYWQQPSRVTKHHGQTVNTVVYSVGNRIQSLSLPGKKNRTVPYNQFLQHKLSNYQQC